MRVIVYSRPGCVACAQTIRMLTGNGVAFTVRSADEHREHLAAVFGARSLPVVTIDEGSAEVEHWQGLRPDLIRSWSRRWLAARGLGAEEGGA